MNLLRWAALAALGFGVSGCATIVEGTTQSVSVTTTPQVGAQCTLANSQGTWFVTSPGSVVVHKTKTDLDVTCKKDGYLPGHLVAPSHFGATTAANVALGVGGVVVGGVVDAASGANYSYDNPITVPLGPPLQANGTLAPAVLAAQPVRLNCGPAGREAYFTADGPQGYASASMAFSINGGGDPTGISVSPGHDASCRVTANDGTVLASASFSVEPASSWADGELGKHV